MDKYLDLESEWQIVRCPCGANVEVGHGDPVIRKPATAEDFNEAAARTAWYNKIYWRRYGPVYRRLDAEFLGDSTAETPQAEPMVCPMADIKGELTYLRERINRREAKPVKEKGAAF